MKKQITEQETKDLNEAQGYIDTGGIDAISMYATNANYSGLDLHGSPAKEGTVRLVASYHFHSPDAILEACWMQSRFVREAMKK